MKTEAFLSRLQKVKPHGKGRTLPSQKYLLECLRLDDASGMLFWNVRPETHFQTKHEFQRWNSRYANKCASIPGGQGYYLTCIDSQRYKTHRIVFCMVHGHDPADLQIDHINGVRSDNRPCNLRLATQSQNTINFKGARADSSHGFRGISWKAKNKKWQASVCVGGKNKYLGLFDTPYEAKAMADAARKLVFGEFYAG